MKGNVVATLLVLCGLLALASNLGLIQLDIVQLLRTWWPLLLIALGVALFVMPRDDGRGRH
ncbi:MAG: hypothetical protein QG667_2780 [Pseudomonadota bacterium]|jgi:hypothetical protein|nr:hypothetical protein [Pseudomonadota bacterium]